MNEKEAIERVKDLIHTCDVGIQKYGEYDDLFQKDKDALETVLNLIEKQQAEIEKKDKIIDEIVKEFYKKLHISKKCYLQTSIEECLKYKNCIECIKQYFEKKIETEDK